MTKALILVTGSTGKTGTPVVEQFDLTEILYQFQ